MKGKRKTLFYSKRNCKSNRLSQETQDNQAHNGKQRTKKKRKQEKKMIIIDRQYKMVIERT